ncbi:MAG: sulfatase-like hydrolase/transferase [Acidobacteriota bacterium]|nr:sulfatase-like hydrolase/transferase [Acidobacteriota bacterium]
MQHDLRTQDSGLRTFAFVLLSLVLLSCHKETAVVADKPAAIILITIDTLRADSLGFAGNTRVKTPFLDRIASEGIVFTNAHAHNVVTLPSHTNIITGLYPYQHGVRDNAGFKLDPKYQTVATMLRPDGYTTGAFIGALPLDSRFGLNQGFDVYDDNYGKGQTSLDFVIQERPATAVLDAATRWWKSNEGKKRFLWVHLYDPHAPYQPPEPFASQYAADPYLGEIAYVDDALGKAMPPLLGKNTLLIVTADHGEALGDHGELTHGLFAYESTLKIPLIIWQPGVAHRVEASYVRHIDIVPTILDRAGIAKPAALPGASLFGNAKRDSYFESLSVSINRGWAPLTGVIHGSEKYIDLPIAELYDLPKDPRELNNLREERRRDVEEARGVLGSFHAAAPAPNRAISAEEAAQLRSLGYIAGSSAAKKTYSAADDPKNLVAIDNKMHQVIKAYEKHDVDRALALAREVVAARPQMSAGRELLAFVLQQREQIGEAIANLREAIRSGGQTESIRVHLGLLLTESGKADEAVKILAPLAQGNDPDVLNAYGIALADQGKIDAANEQFQRVLQSDPNNAPALQNLGIVALRRDDVQSAQQYLSRALELNPRLPLALNAMGVVFARQGDFTRAVDAWKRAVDNDSRQYDALLNIGRIEGRRGNAAEARAALTRFIKTAPAERYAADIAAAKQALTVLP